MSFTRKVLDQAKSGINSLMGKVSADDTPLSHVDEAQLEAELTRRVAARKAKPRKPQDNPVAKLAGASSEARAARVAAASKREARIHGAQRKRASADAAADASARERAFEEAKRRAYEEPSASSSRPKSRPSYAKRASDRARSVLNREDPEIAKFYKTLNLPYGSDFATVKKAYRTLMRKYHPDLHASSPKKQKAATELSMRVTSAYNGLEAHLKGSPNRK